jgi:hypothetical protein
LSTGVVLTLAGCATTIVLRLAGTAQSVIPPEKAAPKAVDVSRTRTVGPAGGPAAHDHLPE